MFIYEKKLQYPVRIANPNPKLAAAIISQYGGPHGKRIPSDNPMLTTVGFVVQWTSKML